MTTPKEILEKKVRRHRWTWNNYTEADVAHLKSFSEKDCDYIVFGREIAPTTGTPHLQGYVEWRNGTSGKALQNKFGSNKVSIRTCQAGRDDNILYCKKGDQTKDEYKTLKDKGPNYGLNAVIVELSFKEKHQGKPSVFTNLYESMLDTPNYAELLPGHTELCIKYASGVKSAIAAIDERVRMDAIIEEYKGKPLYKWQHSLFNELKYTKANDRNIIWYVDDTGNGEHNRGGHKGKSWFAGYLETHLSACVIENGKKADIAYIYNYEPIVVFDIARTSEAYINYDVMESLKNGRIMSTKYNSCKKRFPSPHIVVFANVAPNFSAMSEDRWVIRRFKDGDCDIYEETVVEATPNIVEPIVEPTNEPINEPIDEEWYDCDDCLESFNASHPCGCFKSH